MTQFLRGSPIRVFVWNRRCRATRIEEVFVYSIVADFFKTNKVGTKLNIHSHIITPAAILTTISCHIHRPVHQYSRCHSCGWLAFAFFSISWILYRCEVKLPTLHKQYRKFETNITGKGIALPQSQFPHSCVCEWFIYMYSHPRIDP